MLLLANCGTPGLIWGNTQDEALRDNYIFAVDPATWTRVFNFSFVRLFLSIYIHTYIKFACFCGNFLPWGVVPAE